MATLRHWRMSLSTLALMAVLAGVLLDSAHWHSIDSTDNECSVCLVGHSPAHSGHQAPVAALAGPPLVLRNCLIVQQSHASARGCVPPARAPPINLV